MGWARLGWYGWGRSRADPQSSARWDQLELATDGGEGGRWKPSWGALGNMNGSCPGLVAIPAHNDEFLLGPCLIVLGSWAPTGKLARHLRDRNLK